jgi:hypothetical protein
VRAGLERDEDLGALGALAALGGVGDRGALGVEPADLGVVALADHLAVSDEDGADEGVGADAPASLLGELERSSEMGRVDFGACARHCRPPD